MNTTSLMVFTGGMVVAGRWAQKKPFSANVAVGTVGVAVFLSLISQFQPEIAERFALVIFITAFLVYGVPIFQGVGLVKK